MRAARAQSCTAVRLIPACRARAQSCTCNSRDMLSHPSISLWLRSTAHRPLLHCLRGGALKPTSFVKGAVASSEEGGRQGQERVGNCCTHERRPLDKKHCCGHFNSKQNRTATAGWFVSEEKQHGSSSPTSNRRARGADCTANTAFAISTEGRMLAFLRGCDSARRGGLDGYACSNRSAKLGNG